MFIKDRVRRTEENIRPEVGTVLRITQSGYTTIMWDNGSFEIFRPHSQLIRVVTGEDALTRHHWHPETDTCQRCGVDQTDGNEFGPCVM